MKALALALALYATAGITAEPEVRIVRLGSEVAFTPNEDFIQRVVNLLRSCSLDSTSYAGLLSTWDAALAARSSIHIKFTTAQALEIAGKSIDTDEILVPLPEGRWPAHFFIRSHGVTHAFTKYRPGPLKGLVWAPPLALDAEAPYPQLANFTDK